MEPKKEQARLFEKPWLALLAVMGASIFSIFLTGALIYGVLGYPDDEPLVNFIQQLCFHVLTGFIIAFYSPPSQRQKFIQKIFGKHWPDQAQTIFPVGRAGALLRPDPGSFPGGCFPRLPFIRRQPRQRPILEGGI